MQNPAKQIVVSGMRPTGTLHLGHWHGVIENWLKLQQDLRYDSYFFVADFHRLTTKLEKHEKIRDVGREMVLDWLAFGVDPKIATVFVQSDIPEHAELHLYLSMITPVGWLERVPSYKDYVASLSSQETSSYGFLGYAVLQTADICLYDGTHVPIGQDQAAHLEISREIVRRFNHLFTTDILLEPKPLFTPSASLPGIDGRKMSKSYDNGIGLVDVGDALEKKVLKFITDPARIKKTDPGDPKKCPVFEFHKIYSSSEEQAEVVQGCTQASMGCMDCKRKLLKNLKNRLEPLQEKRRELAKQPHLIDDILCDGATKAKARARHKLAQVREVMGL